MPIDLPATREPCRLGTVRRMSRAVGVLALVGIAAACGSNGSGSDTTGAPVETTQPETTQPGTTVAATASPTYVPRAIVSLSPTATEMLYAIQADQQVIAVDTLSNYPEAAAEKNSGIEAYTPNVEAIAALSPDLVITDGSNPDLLALLDQLGLNHWEGPAATSLDDVYDQIDQLGQATGHTGPAAELIEDMKADIESIVAEAPDATGLAYYHELDSTYYSATSATFIGQVYSLFGLDNIADAAPGAETQYPQLSAEYIIDANPDLIYLGCGSFCEDTPESVSARPGWDQITAVQDGSITTLDGDVVSRWGPRVVDFARTISESLQGAAS